MADIELHRMGARGVNLDLPAHELDPEWWTLVNNVRFQQGTIHPFTGQMQTKGTPLVKPRWLLPVPVGGNFYWVVIGESAPGLHKIYCIDGTTHTDITAGAGTVVGADTARWNGGVLNGIPFMNNGLSVPKAWINPAPATPTADFAAWTPGYLATMLAKVIRPFKNYLVALQLTEDGVLDNYVLRWSHPAAPGTLPSSWDDTDATKDAGRTTLAETSDFLVDCLPLGDTNIIYKESSIIGMSFIGGNDVFRFFTIIPDAGLIARDCVCAYNNRKNHFVVSKDDVLTFNGQTTESIANDRVRRTLFTTINGDHLDKCWTANNLREREVWFAYPSVASADGWPDRVLVFNYIDNTLTFRDLGDPTIGATDTAAFGTSGYVSTTVGSSWDSDSESWDSDVSTWDDALGAKNVGDSLIAAGGSALLLWTANQGYKYDDYTFTWLVERTSLAVTGRDRAGNWVVEPHRRKLVTEIWIQAGGQPFYVQLGGAEKTDGTIKWGPIKLFTPETQEKLGFTVGGKYIAVRFYGTAYSTITGFTLNQSIVGRYNG